jgi:hypothetical protein
MISNVTHQENEMRVSTILAVAGVTLFAATGVSNAQDMNGMQGNSMGQGMSHKTMTKKQRMMMMKKQQMMKQQMMKQQMMQHNM